MNSDDSSTTDVSKQPAAESPESPGRRKLLHGSVTAMPALLTLQSGAALARSSNLISAAPRGSKDAQGRTLCLESNSVYPLDGSGHLYDLGEPAYGRVSAIHDREYRVSPQLRSRKVSEAEMCNKGGVYYYKDRRGSWSAPAAIERDDEAQSENDARARGFRRRWKAMKVKKGVIVSATALTSFSGEIKIYDL